MDSQPSTSSSMLSDICYERIVGTFYYGLFDDFRLIINKKTNKFNATKLCEIAGKQFRHWKENAQTRELIEEYKRKLPEDERDKPVFTYKRTSENLIIRGTYVPEELIVSLACWISPTFAFKVGHIVKHYFVSKYKKQINSMEKRINKLKSYKEDISMKTKIKNKLPKFILFAKNNGNIFIPFYAIRVQKRIEALTLKRLKKRYPNMEVLLEIGYSPNAMTLYNRIKENIKYAKYYGNHIQLDKGHTIDEFIRDVERLHAIDVDTV